jgi:hypothetical protein
VITLPLAATLTAAVAVGYAAGRVRPGQRLVRWAERQTQRPGLHPQFLLAVPVLVLALALMWIFHPRRTISNRHSWSAEDTLTTPVPTYNPRWADHRNKAL